jgi:2TM domain-containing protein
MMTNSNPVQDDRADVLRERAVKRLKKRRDFYTHLLVFTLVNAFIVAIWAVTGSGFFWPIFPIVGWGIGLVMNAWDTFRDEDFDEEQIQREIRRIEDHRRSRNG